MVVDDVDQFHGRAFAGAALAGDDEQFVECGVQFVGLFEHGLGLGGHVGIGVTFQQFQADRDAGQARAQLMRRVSGEAAFGLEHPVDTVGAQSERTGDVVDLVDPRRRRRGGEVAVADAPGAAREPLEGRASCRAWIAASSAAATSAKTAMKAIRA